MRSGLGVSGSASSGAGESLLGLAAERPAFARLALLDAPAASGRAGALHASCKAALLAGLERTVDPNGDGDTSDHIPVALVGVHASESIVESGGESIGGGGESGVASTDA